MKPFSITLPNDVEQVPLLAAFVDEVCEAAGFDMSLTMSMQLAIEEAVVNVMNYAYPPGTQGHVTIDATATFYETMVDGVADAVLPSDSAKTK
jgi:anti-sigma regulatory factor (Ser/Thr protein kinase)